MGGCLSSSSKKERSKQPIRPIGDSKSKKAQKKSRKKASKIPAMAHSDLTALYKEITGFQTQFNDQSQVWLVLNKAKDFEVMQAMSKKMPDVKELDVQGISEEKNEQVQSFLELYFPNTVGSFEFHYGSPLTSITPFMEGMEVASKKVTTKMRIYNFEIGEQELFDLFIWNKSKDWIGLRECTLSLSEIPNFKSSLKGSTLRILDLSECGSSSHGDWSKNPQEFENLVEGLAISEDFKANLQELWMTNCGFSETQIYQVLKKHGLQHVNIYGAR
ncbi:unnamed protein product [Moneuplotes crassus]|uniref:Uncharacterized protein n=1 Tax=Euplotes crassus TaxID=5936 RepID=A0AAD1Y0N7_EUPCR|nr:unnamed protein product [Moneuplotes crassus]